MWLLLSLSAPGLALLGFCAVYWVAVPPQDATSHVTPLHFDFAPAAANTGAKGLPIASVVLRPEFRQFLSATQTARLGVRLLMPEDEANRQAGVFMVRMSAFAVNGTALGVSSALTMLRHRSLLLRNLHTLVLLPALLFGWIEQSQQSVVALFDEFPTLNADLGKVVVTLSAADVHLYSADLLVRLYGSVL